MAKTIKKHEYHDRILHTLADIFDWCQEKYEEVSDENLACEFEDKRDIVSDLMEAIEPGCTYNPGD